MITNVRGKVIVEVYRAYRETFGARESIKRAAAQLNVARVLVCDVLGFDRKYAVEEESK